jgi:uncharacterized membrane protein SpoIIM required for sporulation
MLYNNGNGVYKITPNRVVTPIYIVPSAAGFARLVVDSKGNIFVGSTGAVIYKITQDGQFSIYAGGSSEGFADGNLQKARFHNPRVSVSTHQTTSTLPIPTITAYAKLRRPAK